MAGSFLLAGDLMVGFVGAITMMGMVLVGLAVLVGKLAPEDALIRILALIAILALAPCVGALMQGFLAPIVKPIFVVMLAIAVVTVCVRALVSLI